MNVEYDKEININKDMDYIVSISEIKAEETEVKESNVIKRESEEIEESNNSKKEVKENGVKSIQHGNSGRKPKKTI